MAYRRLPNFPEAEIVKEWVTNLSVNSRSLGKKYGCSDPTISKIIRKHLSASEFSILKREKISHTASLRQDLRSHENKTRLAYMARNPSAETAQKRSKARKKGAIISAQKRKGRPLSVLHREKLSLAHVGIQAQENSPNWKGGTSKISCRGTGWTRARRQARKRDQNTCQICGKTKETQGRNMDVHHKVSFFHFESHEIANQLSNLVCLCRSCHRKVENGTATCL